MRPGSPGFALGPAVLWRRDPARRTPPKPAGSAEEECARLDAAIAQARGHLRDVMARVASQAGEAEALLFKSHMALLDDPMVTGTARDHIRRDALSAEEAVARSVGGLVARFQSLSDARLRERAADIGDVGQRLLDNLARTRADDGPPRGSVVCAETITPSDVSLLARSAAGLVVAEAGTTSHAVILARALRLPVVLGAGSVLARVREGDPLAVDGAEGTVVLHPDRATAGRYRWRMARERASRQPRAANRNHAAVTRDGRDMAVLANAAGIEDAAAARASGAQGIGLFRTEFLFLDREAPPSEAEQLDAYRQVVARMAPFRVVFRVLDAGADKPLPALALPAQPNPSLGLRGIRLCLKREDLFRTQLRALIRASDRGEVGILLPMVIDVGEVRQARRILAEICREVGTGDAPVPPVGVMVETPAAALMTAELAQEAHFFSIGTNDLVQYVLAVDRQGGAVAELYQPFHPAVLRLVSQVAETAAASGRPTTVCGEMAADPLAVPLFLGMGITALSVAPSAVATVREAIRAVRRSEARHLVAEVLGLATAAEVEERLRRFAVASGRPRVRPHRQHR